MDKRITVVQMSRSRELRVDLNEFKGHDLVALRWWAEPEDGSEEERHPTKNGVSFNVRDLPAVIAALREAEKEARKAGLFNDVAA